MTALTAQTRFFTEEHEIFREQVRNFVNKEIVPHIDQWEEEGLFPKSLYRRMGELGFLGIRYLWGGLSAWGYDCSGLTWAVYRVHGITIPRDADAQFAVGGRRPGMKHR